MTNQLNAFVGIDMNKQPLPLEWIERIFSRLHGRFGNSFTDKFKMGQYDANGNDIGLLNAKHVWSEELAGISPERIKNGLLATYEYAPSCDQFKSQCKSTPIAHQDFVKLPAPPKDLQKAAENLAKIKNILHCH
jgi:hypothetical protein